MELPEEQVTKQNFLVFTKQLTGAPTGSKFPQNVSVSFQNCTSSHISLLPQLVSVSGSENAVDSVLSSYRAARPVKVSEMLAEPQDILSP